MTLRVSGAVVGGQVLAEIVLFSVSFLGRCWMTVTAYHVREPIHPAWKGIRRNQLPLEASSWSYHVDIDRRSCRAGYVRL